MLATLLVGVDSPPARTQRHTIGGHYNVPRWVVASSAADESGNVIANPGFESGSVDGGWHQCGDIPAYVTREHPYSGDYDEYSGTRSGSGEPLGNSGVCQRVAIPQGGLLTARLYQLSNEGEVTYAYQEADLLDDRGNVVVNLYKSANDKRAWVLGRWNLGAYSGRTLWLYFGVHGDGDSKRSTQQFVDDVLLTSVSSSNPK